MKATCYCLVLFGLSFAANALAAEEQNAGDAATNETTAMLVLITSGYMGNFPTTFIKLEDQDKETKLPYVAGIYGKLSLHSPLCNRLYKLRFDPPDDAYSFAASGDRMVKMTIYGYNDRPTYAPNPVPPMLLALPVPTTPFFFKAAIPGVTNTYPQVHSMAEFNAATTTVWYLKPAEKGATGPYANSNLYVKMYGSCMMVLEDINVKPTVSVVEPKAGETVSGIIMMKVRMTENIGVSEMHFRLDGVDIGFDKFMYEHASPLYRTPLDTRMLQDGPHEIWADASLARAYVLSSEKVTFNVKNASPAKRPTNTPTDK